MPLGHGHRVMMDAVERYRGSLLGLAAGDALGTTVEFRSPGTFEPIADMVGGGPFGLRPGEWTDDTSMALCLAESLIECRGFDARAQMQRYVRWWREGHLSSNGRCFDIGNTVRTALERFERNGDPFAGPTAPDTAGNGALMRVAPVALAFASDARAAVHYAGESSRTTHGARDSVDACRYFVGLLWGALHGATKDALLGDAFEPVAGCWAAEPLSPAIRSVALGSFKHQDPPAIRGTGHVVRALEVWTLASPRPASRLRRRRVGGDRPTTSCRRPVRPVSPSRGRSAATGGVPPIAAHQPRAGADVGRASSAGRPPSRKAARASQRARRPA
jgi:ADP-ribosyl-[dinitrogen reductase] hydrolase